MSSLWGPHTWLRAWYLCGWSLNKDWTLEQCWASRLAVPWSDWATAQRLQPHVPHLGAYVGLEGGSD